jgi:hypothetical protein
MRLTAGWYTGARRGDGRIDDFYVDHDGSARRRGGMRVNLDDYVCVAASEPTPARADDGARVEGASASAKERHGWSVSATRTIGNVAPWSMYSMYGVEPPRLRAADLDAVRDVPVMPDETPLADMAKPDEAMRFTSPSECDACSAPNPVGRACTCGGNPERCVRVPPRVKVRTWTQGSATCRVQRRERGEVRVHYWKCGCSVRPESVRLDKQLRWMSRGYATEAVWVATSDDARGVHPTEAGAIAAWRDDLAKFQREEDAK